MGSGVQSRALTEPIHGSVGGFAVARGQQHFLHLDFTFPIRGMAYARSRELAAQGAYPLVWVGALCLRRAGTFALGTSSSLRDGARGRLVQQVAVLSLVQYVSEVISHISTFLGLVSLLLVGVTEGGLHNRRRRRHVRYV